MKKLLLTLLFLIPSLVSADFSVPMTATSTTQGWVRPARVNGIDLTIVGKNFVSTSTSDINSFAGTINGAYDINAGTTLSAGGSATIGNIVTMSSFNATSTNATSTVQNDLFVGNVLRFDGQRNPTGRINWTTSANDQVFMSLFSDTNLKLTLGNPDTTQTATLDLSGLSGPFTYIAPSANGTLTLGTGSTGECAQWSSTNVLTSTGAACASLAALGPSMLVSTNASGALVSTSTPTMASFFATSTTATSTISGNLNVVGNLQAGKLIVTTKIINSALTTGSVMFVGTDKSTTEDNSNFFWDDSNNRLGIGTAAPQFSLHVAGGAGDSHLLFTGYSSGAASTDGTAMGLSGAANPNDYSFQFVQQENRDVEFWTDYGNAGGTGGSTGPRFLVTRTGDIALGGAITSMSAYTGAKMVIKSGLVGIGTVSPTTLFQVHTATNNNWGIRDAGSAGSELLAANDVLGAYVKGTINASTLLLNTPLGGSGNVAIGNTAPASTLGITGNTSIGATYGIVAAPTSGLIVEGNTGIGSTTPWGQLSVTNTSANPSFIVEDSTSPDSSPFIVDASGNVGVGISAPTSLLHVSRSYAEPTGGIASSTVAVFSRNFTAQGTSTISILSRSSAAAGINFGTESTEASGQIRYYAAAGTGATFAGSFIFNSLGTDRFVFDGTGNVGIGTMSPLSQLHIGNGLSGGEPTYRGNIIVESAQTDAATNGLEFKASTAGSGYGYRQATVYDGIANIDFRLQGRQNSATWSNLLTVQGSSGNVGIGTTTPQSRLVIKGATVPTATTQATLVLDALYQAASSVNSLDFSINGDANPSARIGNPSNASGASGELSFYTTTLHSSVAPTERLRIDGSGNVGIASTTPDSKLSIAGSNPIIHLGENTGSGASKQGIKIDNTNSTAGFGMWSDRQTGPNKMYFGISDFATTYFTMDNGTGNFGVGSTSPFATLSVTANTSTIPLAISTTTSTLASSTLFMVDKGGWVHYGGGTPTLSSCGTNPTFDGNSTDQAGSVTFGATASGCTITFSSPAPSKPHCIVSTEAVSLVNAYTVTETTSALTITQAASGGVTFDYLCVLGH